MAFKMRNTSGAVVPVHETVDLPPTPRLEPDQGKLTPVNMDRYANKTDLPSTTPDANTYIPPDDYLLEYHPATNDPPGTTREEIVFDPSTKRWKLVWISLGN